MGLSSSSVDRVFDIGWILASSPGLPCETEFAGWLGLLDGHGTSRNCHNNHGLCLHVPFVETTSKGPLWDSLWRFGSHDELDTRRSVIVANYSVGRSALRYRISAIG